MSEAVGPSADTAWLWLTRPTGPTACHSMPPKDLWFTWRIVGQILPASPPPRGTAIHSVLVEAHAHHDIVGVVKVVETEVFVEADGALVPGVDS